MKKEYLKPDAEFISLTSQEALTDVGAGGAGSGSPGTSELPPGWGEDEF